MIIDATFWVAIAFIIFIAGLVYLKIPQKINSLLNIMIENIKNELNEAEKLKNEAKNLLSESQEKLENAQKENEQIIKSAREESEKLIIEINNKFFQTLENRKKITEQKIVQMKEDAIKSIKDASIRIAIVSVTKLIKTSINKSKLDALFEENLNQAKNTLKKTRA
jgi:F-type H+-transporting ATPase subunit b